MISLDELGLPALKSRAYARILAGAFVSNVGTWMETLTVGVLVTEATGKAGWTGTFAALAYAPTIFLSALGGVAADRLNRRTLIVRLLGVQTLIAACLAGLAFTHTLYLPALALLLFADGCADALLNPAFSATVAELVPGEHLLSARSLTSAQFNLARMTGPMIAAFILAVTHHAGWVFLLNTLSFLAVIAPIAALSLKGPEPRVERGGILADIKAGIGASRHDPGIAWPLMLTFAVAVLVAPFIGLAPAYAIKIFGVSAGGASLLMGCQGLGAMTAALFAARLASRWGRRRLLERSAMALGPVAAAYWLAPALPVAAVAIFVLGGLYMTTLTSLSTSVLLRAPRRLQGRVTSLYSLLLGSGYASGLVWQGWAGDHLGMRGVSATAGAVFAVTAVVLVRRGAFARIDGPVLDTGGGPLAVALQSPAK